MLIASHEAPATLETVSRMTAVFSHCELGMHVARSVLDDLALAVAELATNSIRHAATPPTTLSMEVHVDGTTLRIELADDGAPFADFEGRWEASRSAPMDPMAESGRGLWLVRNAVDRMQYRSEGTNRWTLVRNFRSKEKPLILLVEDDAAILGLYVSVLSRIAQVSCASSVEEARAALADTRFDLVIADFNLGDGISADLLEGQMESGGGMDMPVIFVTGDRTGTARAAGLRHGVHVVLEKPVRPRELLARATEALAAHQAQAVRASARFARDVKPLIACQIAAERNGHLVVSRGVTASTGGGDVFLDLGERDGRERFALADCAGHGMPARMHAALLCGLLAGLAPQGSNGQGGDGPSELLERLSACVYRGGAVENLVCTALAMDLTASGEIELATAGHPAPLLVTRGGEVRHVELHGALPGLLPNCGSRTERLRLAEGEFLLLATDGIAPDSGETLAGIPAAIAETIRAMGQMSAEAAADALEAAINAEFGPYPADDWTFVLVARSPRQPASA